MPATQAENPTFRAKLLESLKHVSALNYLAYAASNVMWFLWLFVAVFPGPFKCVVSNLQCSVFLASEMYGLVLPLREFRAHEA